VWSPDFVSSTRSVIMETNFTIFGTWQARDSTALMVILAHVTPSRASFFSWVRSHPWNWAGLTRQQAKQKQLCCRSAVCEEATVTCFSRGYVHRREDKHSAETNSPINPKQSPANVARHWARDTGLALHHNNDRRFSFRPCFAP